MKSRLLRILFSTALLLTLSAFPARPPADHRGPVPQIYAAALWANSDTVTTNQGMVRGAEDNHSTWAWKAIPYARPPVGELRWQAPQDPEAYTGVRQSEDFCEWCPQTFSDNGTLIVQGSEDCLYLNIWRPRTADTGLPVYLWIHGGSNKVGSADPYLGALLSGRHNLVVVTINYRLGLLGWLTHPALREPQDGFSASGNYALLDIIQSLEWVRDNISAFGGDPENITVAGESAGGVNNLLLMLSPPAEDLFHRVISQSGGLSFNAPSAGDAYTDSLMKALLIQDGTSEGSADAELDNMTHAAIRTYLRSKPVEDLFQAAAGLGSNPDLFTDGAVIPLAGANAFDDPATYHPVPVIIGTTAEEGKLFMYLFGIAEIFPAGLYQLMGKQLTRLTRILDIDSLAYKMSVHDSQPEVFSYIFSYGQFRWFGYNAWPIDDGPAENISWAAALGACHGLDIPFNFGIFDTFSLLGTGEYLFRQDNRAGWEALSETIMSCNAQFARTGDPNGEGLPEWSPFPKSRFDLGPRFMIFDADDEGDTSHMARDVDSGL